MWSMMPWTSSPVDDEPGAVVAGPDAVRGAKINSTLLMLAPPLESVLVALDWSPDVLDDDPERVVLGVLDEEVGRVPERVADDDARHRLELAGVPDGRVGGGVLLCSSPILSRFAFSSSVSPIGR